MKKNTLLFLAIFIEGFVVLAAEILAIRQTMPFTGSGTDTISIIIAAVLLPLAVGYYAGGRFKDVHWPRGRYYSIRKKLLRNIVIAMLFLLPGLSHGSILYFFALLTDLGITNRILMVTAYSLTFLVVPVFLLGQTIPLVSNYFSKDTLAKVTGRMLFFSTVGSFMGAVFSTLILMAFLGVNETAAIVFILLAVLGVMLCRRSVPEPGRIMIILAVIGVIANTDYMLSRYFVVSNNQYNMIRVYENPQRGSRHMSINNNQSGVLKEDGKTAYYILLAEAKFLNTLPLEADPIRILVIGAGGFTFGLKDDYNHYDLIDIDPAIKEVAEKHFLQKDLTPNKHFHAVPARGYLSGNEAPYDLIFVDVYTGSTQVPEHLITREFFVQVRDNLTPHGAVIMNMVVSPSFATPFSRHLDSTIRSVFPYVNRQIIHKYNGWGKRWSEEDGASSANVLYMYLNRSEKEEKTVIYSDLQNRSFLDTKKHSSKSGMFIKE